MIILSKKGPRLHELCVSGEIDAFKMNQIKLKTNGG